MMAKQAKPSPEAKLKEYLRKKYMENDRIADHEDWKDGINQFRIRIYEDIENIYQQLKKIQEKLNRYDKI